MEMEERIKNFGVADEETGEIVLDRVKEKKYLVESGVRLLHEMDNLKEDLKTILEDGKERGYEKKNLKALIDNVFNSQIDDKIEELEGIRIEINNLYGCDE